METHINRTTKECCLQANKYKKILEAQLKKVERGSKSFEQLLYFIGWILQGWRDSNKKQISTCLDCSNFHFVKAFLIEMSFGKMIGNEWSLSAKQEFRQKLIQKYGKHN